MTYMKKIQNLILSALVSIFENMEYDKMTKELISCLLTAARLIKAKNWKSKSEFRMEEWNNEIWNIAINGKLTSNLKVKKGEMKKNNVYDIWGRFLEYVLIRGKGKAPNQESTQFWRRGQ